MSDLIQIAQQTILSPVGLAAQDLDRMLGELTGKGVDAADLYFQSSRLESWVLEDGIIKEGAHNIEQGAGIRVISGEKTGFAYSDELQLPTLQEAARAARAITRSGAEQSVRISGVPISRQLYAAINPLPTLDEVEKVELLRQLDREARNQDPRVKEVIVSLVAAHDVVLVAAIDGTLCADVRPLVRLNVHVIAERGSRREQGSSGGGARESLDYFMQQERGLGYAREAVRQALVNLEAVDAPAGSMPVVLGPGW
ncbi:MAG: metalloprotease TldD, partial [gamma proteobacterium symbiont of Ctena orbiculata]